MPFYQYFCEDCVKFERVISDSAYDDKVGSLTVKRKIEERDNPLDCPLCNTRMYRAVGPERFGVWWCRPQYSKKKECLGPTKDVYPPTEEKRRKERMGPPISISMYTGKRMDAESPKDIARRKELARDANTAPTKKEVPAPGVSKGG